MMDLFDAFEHEFFPEDVAGVESICTFSEESCLIIPKLWQRVVLKLLEGEDLLEDPVEPYDISETEWLELMYNRNRFPPDLYERIAETRGIGFENVNLVCGRRSGKTTVIGVSALYGIRKLLVHPNPQRYYGIQEGVNISVAVAATSDEQANEMPFGVIQAILRNAVENDTPFTRHLDDDGVKSDTVYFMTERDRQLKVAGHRALRGDRIASVRIKSYHTNQKSLRGGNIIDSIFDEFGWFPITEVEDKGETYYEMLTAAQEQFMPDARAFVLSSPAFQYGKFFDMYQAAWEGESPRTLSLHMPSWEAWEFEPNPLVTLRGLADNDRNRFRWDHKGDKTSDGKPEPLAKALERAPASFKREWGAQFEGSEAQWLEKETIDMFFDPRLSRNNKGDRTTYYYMDLDPAVSNDAFAISIGHYADEETDNFIIDYAWRWYVAPDEKYKPQHGYETVYFRDDPDVPAVIDLEEVFEELCKLLKKFNIYHVTSDQHDSHGLTQRLQRWAVRNKVRTRFIVLNSITRQYNIETSDDLKQQVLEGEFKCYPHPIARWELTGLQKNRRGVVEKSPRFKDDIFDTWRRILRESRNKPRRPLKSVTRDALTYAPRLANARL